MLNFTKNKDFPEVLVKKGAVRGVEKAILKDFELDDVLFVSDEKIIRNSGKFLPKDFLQKIKQKLILKTPKADDKFVEKIKKSANKSKLIIGFGSGTINDLCKICAKELGINYAIIASAASMNGYLSKNASISVNGHKKTLPATLPKLVICDPEILKSAPKRLTKAGIGDSLCFYSCWFDWYLSHKILGTKFDEELFLMQKDKVDYLIKNYEKFDLEDDKLLTILIEILLLSGWSMTLAGGSYPASQSEHLISHVMEMKYGKQLKNSLHGLQIALTTLVSSRLQRKILCLNKLTLEESTFPEKEMTKFFGKEVAKQCELEFNKKIFRKKRLNEINANLEKNWPSIKSELAKLCFDEKKLRAIFTYFKIKSYPSNFGISQNEFRKCVKYARFIRDRFGCLDLIL